jgi:hypothetical protein
MKLTLLEAAKAYIKSAIHEDMGVLPPGSYTPEFQNLMSAVEDAEKPVDTSAEHDPVDHPAHYTSSPSGVECIQVTEHMSFCAGNAMKYLWRHEKKDSPIEDLKKSRWYIDREIERLNRLMHSAAPMSAKEFGLFTRRD